MPMYFILSGYVLRKDSSSFQNYLKAKFYRIFLPAILLYLFSLPLYFYYLDYSAINYRTVISTIFYINGKCAYNVPIWFFFCMFQVLLFVKYLRLSESSNNKLVIILLMSLTISYMCNLLGWRYLNLLGFNKFLLGLFFMVLGLLLKRMAYSKSIGLIGLYSLPIWIIAGIICNTKVSMYGVKLGNFWLFIIAGITGSFVFIALSKLLEKKEKINQYAKWTIFIVCTHYLLATFFKGVASILSVRGTYLFDITSAIFVLIALILYKLVCVFLNKHIPILLGNYNYYAKDI